jgi:hypothetical protein
MRGHNRTTQRTHSVILAGTDRDLLQVPGSSRRRSSPNRAAACLLPEPDAVLWRSKLTDRLARSCCLQSTQVNVAAMDRIELEQTETLSRWDGIVHAN